MAFGGYGAGGRRFPAGPAGGSNPIQRTIIIVVVAVALMAILFRTHKINRFEIIYFCVLIPSIILHELSHGVVALALGDDTAKRAGRLTLNPAKHVDPVGTLLVPAVLSLSGHRRLRLGQAGAGQHQPPPEPPQPHGGGLAGRPAHQLRAGRRPRGGVVVATRHRTSVHPGTGASATGYYPTSLLSQILFIAGIANIVLGVFNLIPCPPLDGASVLERFLPARMLPRVLPHPALAHVPALILILLFRNEWSQLIGHVISWWSGFLG
jgi:Zn-dependent protease